MLMPAGLWATRSCPTVTPGSISVPPGDTVRSWVIAVPCTSTHVAPLGTTTSLPVPLKVPLQVVVLGASRVGASARGVGGGVRLRGGLRLRMRLRARRRPVHSGTCRGTRLSRRLRRACGRDDADVGRVTLRARGNLRLRLLRGEAGRQHDGRPGHARCADAKLMLRRRSDEQPRDENSPGDRDGQQDPCEHSLGGDYASDRGDYPLLTAHAAPSSRRQHPHRVYRQEGGSA